MKRRLVTSALPYVNNVPHLGNLIQVLSADVFARFCRLRGYETLYVCGTDEYGTATETKALEEGISPASSATASTRSIATSMHGSAYPSTIRAYFDGAPDRDHEIHIPRPRRERVHKEPDYRAALLRPRQALPRGSVRRGTCPSCGYDGARGDQCENCGKLLDPTDLRDPVCSTCGSTPDPRAPPTST